MSKTLLLVSALAEDLAFAQAVAANCGMEVQQLVDPLAAAQFISQNDNFLVFVDASTEAMYSRIENAIQESVGLFSEKINANAIHFLSSGDLETAKYLIQSPLFGHFIMRNYGDPKAAGEHYGRIVSATMTERAFGLANLLKPGSKIQQIKLTSSKQKNDAVEAIKAYLLSAKFQSRMATIIANAVDELLLNSIFDAPVDDLGKPTLVRTPRSTVISLADQSLVELHVGFDGQYAAITAIDNFGSLDKVKLISHIAKIYTSEEYQVKTAVAGAGIGLATVFRTGGSFFFVSESRVRTEVTVFFKRADNFREFRDQFRFLSTQFYF